jgi:hypothetical protein
MGPLLGAQEAIRRLHAYTNGPAFVVSNYVSNDCKREFNAAPRSKTFSEPISRKAGSCERPSASLTVLVARQSAVYPLPHQVDQEQLGDLPPTRCPLGEIVLA